MYFSLAVTSMRAELPFGKVPTTLVLLPDLAVDALDPVVRPDPAPVLRREFRVGKRLGEPAAHRLRGRPAELRHADFDFSDARDEPPRVVAAAVGPEELGRLLVEQRVGRLLDGLPHQILHVVAQQLLVD